MEIKKKRKVSSNLWRTQHQNADIIYNQIRRRIWNTKSCPFYKWKKIIPWNKKTHNELNPWSDFNKVPIEDFDFQFDKKKWLWSLQSYCKVCYKVYRQARIKNSRGIFSDMSDAEIRNRYIKNVWETMMCSKCNIEHKPENFRSSKSMEKWLHNICYDCEGGHWSSIREKEWLSEWDWDSWAKAVFKLRWEKKVLCAWWKSSVDLWYCKWIIDGKSMHADHIIPLRAGWINDVRNFQPLCSTCNTKKSSQIDNTLAHEYIKSLVGSRYKHLISRSDSILTVERKLKKWVVDFINQLHVSWLYKEAIKKKKKEVNGQWVIDRIYKKWIDWLKNQI